MGAFFMSLDCHFGRTGRATAILAEQNLVKMLDNTNSFGIIGE
jgi:hypothetical protein